MLYHNNGCWENLSCIGLGCWNLGKQWGKVTKQEAINIIRYAIDQGINFVDVAESYGIPDGECEILLGKALADGYRDKVKIISKIGWYGRRINKIVKTNLINSLNQKLLNKTYQIMGKKLFDETIRSPELIRLSGHACCGRLNVQQIDLLLCHDGAVKDPIPFIKGFKMLKEEGFIANFGISTDSFVTLKRFYEESEGECIACEFDYSLLNRAPELDIIPFCKKNKLIMLTRGALATGLLSGKYDINSEFKDYVRNEWNRNGKERNSFLKKIKEVEQIKEKINIQELIATAYRFAYYENKSVIMGCTSIKQLQENINIASQELNPNNYFLYNK